MKTCISMADLETKSLVSIIDFAEACKLHPCKSQSPKKVNGKILGTIFLSDSMRTRAALHCAMLRLGGGWVDFGLGYIKSGYEDMAESVVYASNMVDVLAVRGPSTFNLERLRNNFKIPVINAMAGQEFPLAGLAFLQNIKAQLGKLSGLKIGIYGLTGLTQSCLAFCRAIARFAPEIYEDSVVDGAGLSPEYVKDISIHGGKLVRRKLNDFIGEVDFLFITEGVPCETSSLSTIKVFNSKCREVVKTDVDRIKKGGKFFYAMPCSLTNKHPIIDKELWAHPKCINSAVLGGYTFTSMGLIRWLVG